MLYLPIKRNFCRQYLRRLLQRLDLSHHLNEMALKHLAAFTRSAIPLAS